MRTRNKSLVISLFIFAVLIIPIVTSPKTGNHNNIESESKDVFNLEGSKSITAASAGWLMGWEYRKLHNISGSSGAGINYQVRFTVHYGTGSDFEGDAYCDSNCQSDFDDIRFTDNDGVTELDYWREYYIGSDNAVFWVEIQDSLDSDVSIYIYYGNDAVSTTSDGDATFIFFDDYEDQDLSEWDTIIGSCTITSDQVARGQYSVVLYDSPGPQMEANITGTNDPVTHDFMVHNWVRDDNQLRGGHAPLLTSIQENNKYVMRGYESSFQYMGTSDYTTWPQNSVGGSDTWFEIELGVSYTTDKFRAWKNGIYMGEIDLTANNGNPIPDDIFSLRYSQQSGYRTWYDDTYVRKWIILEPEHSDWGNAETWLSGWTYRKSHVVMGSVGAGTNYQIQINVHYNSGIDNGRDVYCDLKCQSDFDDIRFTDDDGVSLLDYWREEYTDSDNATFWVEIQDNLDTDITLYIYYGNSGVSTSSNGAATFVFFDDFEDGSIDLAKWDAYGPWTESGSTASFTITSTGSSIGFPSLRTDDTWDMRNKAIVSRWRINELTLNREWGVSCADTSGDDHTKMAYFLAYNTTGDNYIRSYFDVNSAVGYDHYGPIIGRYIPNTFMTTEFVSVPSNTTKNSWVQNGSVVDTYNSYSFDSSPQFIFLGFYVYGWTGTLNVGTLNLDFDYVFLRKIIGTEPSHDVWGPEHSALIHWYHDGSNSTGFTYNDGWNINWMQWNIVSGDLSSDGSNLSVTNIPTGANWHGPVFEYEIPQPFLVENLLNFSVVVRADNSLTSYLGYQVVMLGDANRNPVMFVGFHDGWADYTRGSYGVSFVYGDGSRSGFGSGYPVTWTAFDGSMSLRYNESQGLQGYVEGVGDEFITTLAEVDKEREIKYVAIAAARYGSDPLFPMLVDEISILSKSLVNPVEEPFISTPEDVEAEAGISGTKITWTIGNFTPISYDLYRNSGLLESSSWPGGSEFSTEINNLFPGVYNYTLVVYDSGGDSVSDTVIVTIVDTTAPSLGHPADISYEYGSTGNTIVWTVSDLYPNNYTVTRDDTLIEWDTWDDGSIVIEINGLDLGVYDYEISVFDDYDNYAVDTVVVTVEDTTSPIITHPADVVLDIGSESFEITWQVTDLLPFTYEIYQNDTLYSSGTWVSGANLTYSRTGLSPGVYEITIIVRDTSGNTATDTVFVTISTGQIAGLGDFIIIGITFASIGVIVIVGVFFFKGRGGSIPITSGFEYG